MDEVKGIMTENIEKVLARGEKLELLTDKTENLMNEVRLGTSRVLLRRQWRGRMPVRCDA